MSDTNERAVPIPEQPDSKFQWQRRFTSLVQERLASGGRDGAKMVTPGEAGEFARDQIRREFSEKFPGVALPAFIP